MGTDKALMTWQGKRLAQYSIDLAVALDLPVFLSVKDFRREEFQIVFRDCGIIPDVNGLSLQGPAKGILSAHLCFPSEDWLVLPCDMPLLTQSLALDLLECHRQFPDAAACLYSKEGLVEPLFGVYTSTALRYWFHQDETARLQTSGMKYLLSQVQVKTIPLDNKYHPFFLNANSPSDLEAGFLEK
jgi:molybdopterin-guanine dinucleotide biosynthesis protein A